MSTQSSNTIDKFVVENGGYTLLELLITIFLMGIILTSATLITLTLTRVTYQADTRRDIRQDVEFALEVIRKDIKNADKSLSVPECDKGLFRTNIVENGGFEGSPLELTLIGAGQRVLYSYSKAEEGNVQIERLYASAGGTTKSVLTSSSVNIKQMSFQCSKTQNGSKYTSMTLLIESTQKNKNGEPIVSEYWDQIWVTMRN